MAFDLSQPPRFREFDPLHDAPPKGPPTMNSVVPQPWRFNLFPGIPSFDPPKDDPLNGPPAFNPLSLELLKLKPFDSIKPVDALDPFRH